MGDCWSCQGTGGKKIYEPSPAGGPSWIDVQCSTCEGTGMAKFGKPKDPPPPATRSGYAKELRVKRLLDLAEDVRAEMLRAKGLEKQNLAEACKFIDMALNAARQGV